MTKHCMLVLGTLLMTWQLVAQTVVTHTVKRKETAYSIAKAYGIDLNSLFDSNPWAEGGIRKGDVLRIPEPAKQDAPAGISGGELPTNADDSERLPSEDNEEGSRSPLSSDDVQDEGLGDSLSAPRGRPVPPTWSADTIRVAVFLPFYSGRDSLGRQESRLREIARDCAAGIELALDTGRHLGAICDVRFLDTGRDTSGQLNCSPIDLQNWGGPADLAIGPLKRSQFREVRRWSGVEGAVHLALTDLGASLLEGAEGVLMPYVPVAKRMEGLAAHVARIHAGEQVLLLVTGDIRNLEAEDAFRSAWDGLAASDSLLMLEEVEVSSKGLGSLRETLTDVRRNVLVVPGGKANRSFAGVLQTEIQLGDSLDFVLYADDAWRTFEFLDPEVRERTGFTVVDGGGSLPDSSVFGPLDSAHFCLARRLVELRGGDAGSYGWMAHDAVRSALEWTAGHGKDWPQRIGSGEMLIRPQAQGVEGLHPFAWMPMGTAPGGLLNGAIRILRQEGFQWVEVGRDVIGVMEEPAQGNTE